jgi:ELWxxDGT repeat protein
MNCADSFDTAYHFRVSVQKTLSLAGLLTLSLLAASSIAAQPHLVKDINLSQSPVSSMPGGFASIGNVTYFFASDAASGNELWKTDGTTLGTVLVRDIRPGPDSGVPNDRVGASIVGNRMLFLANDGAHGLEVWSTDGSSDGTVMLADIAAGAASSNPVLGPVVGSTAYFTATAPATGTELWRTDGTIGGTRVVQDLNPGASSSSPRMLGAFGSLLVVQGFDGSKTTLYTTDGTAEGTKAVGPFPGTSGIGIGTSFLFTVSTGSGKWDLMKTDGTSGGTSVIRPAFSGILPTSFAVAKGVAYFVADDGISGSEVWASDGSAGGTHLLADLAPGSASLTVRQLSIIGDRLLITTGPTDGQLWSSDGTAAGTTLVKSVPFATPGIVSGGYLYFFWNDGAHGYELWKSDGSTAGTALVADIAPGAEDSIFAAVIAPRPDGVFFRATDLSHGFEPWISDGTPAGTRMVKNIAADTALGSYPSALADLGGKLFFTAWDGVAASVWTSDGSEAGTLPLVASQAGGVQPNAPGVVSNGVYYYIAGALPQLELWRTDGTAAGTFRLFQQPESRNFDALIPFKGGLFFQATDDAHGVEPWFTDGTVAGTRRIADISPGAGGSFFYAKDSIAAGGYVYFSAQGSGPGGQQAWRTDGTTVGTQELSTPDWRDSVSPQAFTQVGDWVFFAASLNSSAFNLWKSNVASGETILVRRFVDKSAPWAMWNVGGTLLFTLKSELWRSDGTEGGTTMVRDAIAVPPCADRGAFAVGGSVLFWFAFNNSFPYIPQLWRSDGTTAGTFRLGTFEGPYADSMQPCAPQQLHYHHGRLYFTGNDDIHGAEPWVTDGTIAGTHLLNDINPGVASSDAGQFITAGGTLYFTAATANTGYELWAACVDDCPVRRRAAGR